MIHKDLANCNEVPCQKARTSLSCMQKAASLQSLGYSSRPYALYEESEIARVLVCHIVHRINQGRRQKRQFSFCSSRHQHQLSLFSDDRGQSSTWTEECLKNRRVSSSRVPITA